MTKRQHGSHTPGTSAKAQTAMAQRILVIRLGALGDIVQSFAPFAAIRAHHPRAHITLLTTAPFADWLRAAPWFNAVVIDARPALWHLPQVRKLRTQLRGFDLVYDLQTSRRSTWYFWLAGCPPWSGIGWWRRYPHRDPARNHLHTWDRQRGQLRDAGIAHVPLPDLRCLCTQADPQPTQPYAILVPGTAPGRPNKRWPIHHYVALARLLHARGLTVIAVGAAADQPLGRALQAAGAQDRTGRTTLPQLAALLAGAAVVIGNDTGPMHLAATLGAPCVVLFGPGSVPALTAPRTPDGAFATVLRAEDLAQLSVDRVAAAVP